MESETPWKTGEETRPKEELEVILRQGSWRPTPKLGSSFTSKTTHPGAEVSTGAQDCLTLDRGIPDACSHIQGHETGPFASCDAADSDPEEDAPGWRGRGTPLPRPRRGSGLNSQNNTFDFHCKRYLSIKRDYATEAHIMAGAKAKPNMEVLLVYKL